MCHDGGAMRTLHGGAASVPPAQPGGTRTVTQDCGGSMTKLSDTTVYSRASNIATAVLGVVLITLGLVQLGLDPWPHWKLSEPLSLLNVAVGALFIMIGGFRLWGAHRRQRAASARTAANIADTVPAEQAEPNESLDSGQHDSDLCGSGLRGSDLHGSGLHGSGLR